MKSHNLAILIYLIGAGAELIGVLHWTIPDSCHRVNIGSALFFGIGFLTLSAIAFFVAYEHRNDPH